MPGRMLVRYKKSTPKTSSKVKVRTTFRKKLSKCESPEVI